MASLKNAGFDAPRLFVDGAENDESYRDLGLPVSTRFPRLRVAGNWSLSLVEMYVRDPNAERFVLFQDDAIACRGLREYITHCRYPEKGYLNLYTVPRNARHAPKGHQGWYESDQRGRGAVGLVFNREAVTKLLANDFFVCRIQDEHRGWRLIDGGIVTAMKNVGWKEFVHSPSLVDHIGEESTWKGNIAHQWYAKSADFPGEEFDAVSLL
jgi:hypothetical protein